MSEAERESLAEVIFGQMADAASNDETWEGLAEDFKDEYRETARMVLASDWLDQHDAALLASRDARLATVEALADEVANLIGDEPHMDHGGGNGLNVEYCPRCWMDGIRAALRSDPDEASTDA